MEETNSVILKQNPTGYHQTNKSNFEISSEYLCIADKYIKQFTGVFHLNFYDWKTNRNKYEKGNIPCINIWN